MSQSLWKREEKKTTFDIVINRCHKFYVTWVLPGEESKHAAMQAPRHPEWLPSILRPAVRNAANTHAGTIQGLWSKNPEVDMCWMWELKSLSGWVVGSLSSGMPTSTVVSSVVVLTHCHYYSTQLLPFIRRFGVLLFFSLIHTVVLLSNTHTSLYFFFDSIQFKGSSTTWICPSNHKRFPIDW